MFVRLWGKWLFVVALLACSGLATSCDAGLCYYCGSYYNEGQTFSTFDLCNSCTCVRDKVTGLGRVDCDLSNKCDGYCYYGSSKYSSKTRFLDDNGTCFTCDCRAENTRVFDDCGGLVFCLGVRPCFTKP